MFKNCAALVIGLSFVLVSGCTGIPKGTQAVTGFEPDRYLGEWFEIARLDHSFERGLDCVTANYSLRTEDDGIRVLNRGVKLDEEEVEEAEARAYLIGEEGEGRLKVSFSGPFFASYNILELDEDYQWAIVSGPSRKFLWILAREPELEESVYLDLLRMARDMDFAVDELIEVEQGEVCDPWRQ